MPIKYVDSHCHLDMLDLSEFDDHMDNVIRLAKQNQVSDILSITVDLESFPRILDTARNYPNVHASVGLHPCHLPENNITIEQLSALADDSNVIAIGETGLDYYMNNGCDPLEDNFSWQSLEEENAEKIGGIMHCFVEDIATAEKALAMGFYISFSGIVTFKNAKSIQEVAKMVPENRLLIETDSPYLAPVPMRGKKNQPAYVAYVAEFLAELRGVSIEHIADVTRDNYFRLFKLNDLMIY
jgi:TatD DNase family protein